jgi:Tfp pilus assembly pilus retraction ATPase PilT
LHQHKTALVNQRELHADTQSFSHALRAALREDPDVVLVGELRDLETMEAALKLAETGHLTMATLHTNSAAQTITRLIDAFPGAPAGADPHAAVARARRHRVSGPLAESQRAGTRRGSRNPHRHARRFGT